MEFTSHAKVNYLLVFLCLPPPFSHSLHIWYCFLLPLILSPRHIHIRYCLLCGMAITLTVCCNMFTEFSSRPHSQKKDTETLLTKQGPIPQVNEVIIGSPPPPPSPSPLPPPPPPSPLPPPPLSSMCVPSSYSWHLTVFGPTPPPP